MQELIKKYRHDCLSDAELDALRDKLNSLNDSAIHSYLQEDWQSFIKNENCSVDKIKSKIKRNISQSVRNKDSLFTRKNLLLASVAMLCGAILSSVILWFNIPSSNHSIVAMHTTDNNITDISLPDATHIKLNKNSLVTFSEFDFTGNHRAIHFSGEGYFKVTHEPARPFIIYSEGVTTTVFGTEFNINTNTQDEETVVSLINGNLKMTADKTKAEITLKPGEKGVFNKLNGSLTKQPYSESDNITSWISGEINFENETMDKVISFIESHYKCRIIYPHNISKKRFTGTLPANDLDIAVKTLEKVFATSIEINK